MNRIRITYLFWNREGNSTLSAWFATLATRSCFTKYKLTVSNPSKVKHVVSEECIWGFRVHWYKHSRMRAPRHRRNNKTSSRSFTFNHWYCIICRTPNGTKLDEVIQIILFVSVPCWILISLIIKLLSYCIGMPSDTGLEACPAPRRLRNSLYITPQGFPIRNVY